jgi:hypothetical protein
MQEAGDDEPERRADELSHVGGHSYHLALHPHGPGDRAGKPVADQFGQCAAGEVAQLGGQEVRLGRDTGPVGSICPPEVR